MKILSLFRKTFQEFFKDKPLLHSSSIAFYTVFSLPPIFILATRAVAELFPTDRVETELYKRINQLIGEQGAEYLRFEVAYDLPNEEYGFYAVTVSIITLVLGGTAVFVALQNSINAIWGIKPKPGNNFKKFLWNRVLSFATLLGMTFIVLISLILDTAIALVSESFNETFFFGEYFIVVSNATLMLITSTFIFALFYKVLPDAKIRWKDVWIGALGTAILFFTGKYLIGLYLGNGSFSTLYGKAGAFVVILIWVYYSALVLLLGAEFTYVQAHSSGQDIKPLETAVEVETIEVEKGDGTEGS